MDLAAAGLVTGALVVAAAGQVCVNDPTLATEKFVADVLVLTIAKVTAVLSIMMIAEDVANSSVFATEESYQVLHFPRIEM